MCGISKRTLQRYKKDRLIVKPLIGRPGIFTRMEEDVLAAYLRTHLACGIPLSSKAFLKDVRKFAQTRRKFSAAEIAFAGSPQSTQFLQFSVETLIITGWDGLWLDMACRSKS